MKQAFVTAMVFTARISGLAAACTGAFVALGRDVPVLLHIVIGSLLVTSMCVLAFEARRLSRYLILAAIALAGGIPIFGLLEYGAFYSVLLWLHPILGVGGIAVAEVLAMRIKVGLAA